MNLKMPLRFKVALICLVSLAILGAGAVTLFSKAWVDLSRAYGLLSINRRLENSGSGEVLAKQLESGEWAVEFVPGAPEARWVKPPEGLDEATLADIAKRIRESVEATRLNQGSFEFPLDAANPGQTAYFVAFRELAGQRTAVATRAHRSLWDLSPWAAPFLGFFLIALAVSVVLVSLLTSRLTRAYELLGKAMRDVGAGRLQNLELPDSGDGAIQSLTESLRGMTSILAAKEQKIAEVSQLADEDAMTGMKNYRAFTNYMKTVFERYKTKGDIYPVLGIVDLDFFKKVNDNYGHQVGDFVLRHTSQLIKASIRYEATGGRLPDFCGRYGGEEFVVIFSECQDRSAHIAPMRLMKAIKAQKLIIPDEINEKGAAKELIVSASIGIAAWDPTRFKTKEEWIKEADAALYEAKHRGRARLVRTHPKLQEWV